MQFDVRCSECEESGTAKRMDLDESGKCYYCRAEDSAGLPPVVERPDRLSAAREGVVKALEQMTLLTFADAAQIDWDVGEAGFSECYFDVRDAARAALKELEKARREG
ncbi:hypothetical protein LCGC14_1150020 [marine sediment metagenome]|uniref:Uncharacterized protein n=1 Tax=marine sediment metagenome TaxID=412755 RepID=A0A0F9LVP6_9ZZZZ